MPVKLVRNQSERFHNEHLKRIRQQNVKTEKSVNKPQLRERLELYWRLELFSAFLLPMTGLGLLFVFEQGTSMLSIASLATMSSMLVLGGFYWKAKAQQLSNHNSVGLEFVLSWAQRLRIPILIAVSTMCVLCLADALATELTAGWPDQVLALCAMTLALLEYVNYYHVQLQHFDHWADFHRLISGRGFRRAHLRADLERRKKLFSNQEST